MGVDVYVRRREREVCIYRHISAVLRMRWSFFLHAWLPLRSCHCAFAPLGFSEEFFNEREEIGNLPRPFHLSPEVSLRLTLCQLKSSA